MPRKTTVGVAASPLFPNPPDKEPYSDVLLKNILQKESIPNDIIRYHTHSFDGKLQKYYDYAKDHYIYGLPHGYGTSTPLFNTAHQDIANVIAGIEGQSIQLLTAEIVTNTNAVDEAKFFMHWYRGFLPSTGEVNSTSIGLPATTITTFSSAVVTSTNQLQITYTLSTGGTHTEVVDFRFYAPGIPVIVATYRMGGEDYTWVYAPVTGEFPTLTKIVLESDTFEYFPLVPIRYNKINIANERENFSFNDNVSRRWEVINDDGDTVMSERNQSIRKLLNHVGFNLDDLSEAITENPDINYIDDAFLTNCIMITEDKQLGLRYLFEYFSRMALTQTSTRTEFEAWKSNPTTTSPTTQVIIRDRSLASESEYNHNLIFNYIETTTVNQSGIVGRYYSNKSYGSGEDIHGHYISNDVFTVEYQISPTQRTRLRIHGIRQLGYINKGNGERLVTETSLDEAFSVSDPIDGMYVPLCKNIIDTWTTEDATQIGYMSFHIIIQSVVVTKVKWYQTGIFKAILVIVAAVITVWTQNPAAFQTIVGAIYAIAYTIAVNLVIGFLIHLVFMDLFVWLVEEIGGELATIIATMAAITAIAYGGGDAALQFADELLLASNVMFGAIQKHTVNEFTELQQEMEDFYSEAEEVQEEIDKAQDLLSTNLEVLDLVEQTPDILGNESYDSFFMRTIHLNNPGVLSLDMAENYHDNMLTLPQTTM